MPTEKEIEAAARAIVGMANSRGEYETPAEEWTKDDFETHAIWADASAALVAAEKVRNSL